MHGRCGSSSTSVGACNRGSPCCFYRTVSSALVDAEGLGRVCHGFLSAWIPLQVIGLLERIVEASSVLSLGVLVSHVGWQVAELLSHHGVLIDGALQVFDIDQAAILRLTVLTELLPSHLVLEDLLQDVNRLLFFLLLGLDWQNQLSLRQLTLCCREVSATIRGLIMGTVIGASAHPGIIPVPCAVVARAASPSPSFSSGRVC